MKNITLNVNNDRSANVNLVCTIEGSVIGFSGEGDSIDMYRCKHKAFDL